MQKLPRDFHRKHDTHTHTFGRLNSNDSHNTTSNSNMNYDNTNMISRLRGAMALLVE